MAAPALPPGKLLRARPWQRVVAPLAGDVVAAAHDFAVHHHAAAAAGAEDDAEHHALTRPGAVDRLRKRETVGVVLHPHLAVEQSADVTIERVPVQGDRVGVLHQAGDRADHARDADPHGCGNAQPGFRVAHQAGDALQGCLIAVWRVDAVTEALAAVGADDRDFDLGAAEVDADAVLHGVGLKGGR